MESSWEGSAIDHTLALILLFVYHFADDEERMRIMWNFYKSLSDALKCHERPIFVVSSSPSVVCVPWIFSKVETSIDR